MNKYEVAIACWTAPEEQRINEGDIVAWKPHPHEWGNKEINQFLIIPVTGATKEDLNNISKPMQDEEEKIIRKRKFSIPLDIVKKHYPDLDFDRVRDVNDIYQPLKDNNIFIDISAIGENVKNHGKENR